MPLSPRAPVPFLRVGCGLPRPWSLQTDRMLIRRELEAADFVARTLGCDLHVVHRLEGELHGGLLNREYDVVFGSLTFPAPRSVLTVEIGDCGSDGRRCGTLVSFPNVWWVRQGERALAWRLQLILATWQRPASRRRAFDQLLIRLATSGYSPRREAPMHAAPSMEG